MPSQNTIYVPDSTKHDQVWAQSNVQPPCRESSHAGHSLDVVGIDATSVGSNVDTLDSGFSSDRFHAPHHHNHPILPGHQVIYCC